MYNYDFLNLSPNEFENLTRDLLQKKLNHFIESFTTGKDSGIDLRCVYDKRNTVIIQAKRYKDYNSLYGNLKKEVIKVNDIAPSRYILSTSVGLTPANKDEISKLFDPHIQTTEDILGKDDLNNLLRSNKDIELKYYKLWLASTNILEKVLHSKIYNQSAFELDEIREHVRLYVQNESFNDALKIIRQHNYVIISGIPGIGKTTLARVLALYLLFKHFDEFVYLNDSIDDAYKYFQEGKKQVFFFDDFLGKNFFESKEERGQDNKLVKFIEKIKKTPDKILLLTTREYILNQAKLVYETFRINNIEIAKCTLDLNSYTNVIKAQILYNHLFFAGVPLTHLADLVDPKKHLPIVKHLNYNPRVIETIVNRRIWESCQSGEFGKALKSYFDNPESVWLYAFENSLNKFSQYTLLVLLTMGTPVKIDSLETALITFLKENQFKFQISFDSIVFMRSLKELENTFIRTQKDSTGTIAIEYQNPSIQDFLVNYLRDKKDLIDCLIQSAIYAEQFFGIFVGHASDEESMKKRILLGESQKLMTFQRIEKLSINKMMCCKVLRLRYSENDQITWGTISFYKYQFLRLMLSELATVPLAIPYVQLKFKDHLYIDSGAYYEVRAYLELLRELDRTDLDINEEKAIDSFLNHTYWLNGLEEFAEFSKIFPVTYRDSIGDSSFAEKIEEIVQRELDEVQNSDMDNLLSTIRQIGSEFSIDLNNYIKQLKDKIEEYEEDMDRKLNSYLDSDPDEMEDKELNEEDQIAEIFKSLANDE